MVVSMDLECLQMYGERKNSHLAVTEDFQNKVEEMKQIEEIQLLNTN